MKKLILIILLVTAGAVFTNANASVKNTGVKHNLSKVSIKSIANKKGTLTAVQWVIFISNGELYLVIIQPGATQTYDLGPVPGPGGGI